MESEQLKSRFNFSDSAKSCALIFAIALLIRLVGIQWGLADNVHNQTFHPDEEVNWRYSQQMQPARLNFLPGYYGYGTLYFTFLNVASDVTASYTGVPVGPNDWKFIARCELAGRIISALAGSGFACLVFLSGLKLKNKFTGWIAGLVIAVSPGLVVHSRFATVDMLAAFLVAVSGLFACRILVDGSTAEKETMKWAIWAGIFAGLSAGTKYTGVIAIFMAIAALLITKPNNYWKSIWASVLASVIAFIVSTPGVILDSKAFWRDFSFELLHSESGHGLVFEGTSSGFIYQISNLILGMGLILALCGIGSLIYFAIRKNSWAWILLAFAIPTYILIGKSQVKFFRYCIPFAYPLALGIGMLASSGDQKTVKGRAWIGLAVLGLSGVDGGGLASTIQNTGAMLAPDPRVQAANYIQSQSSNSTTLGLASDPWFWTPPIFANTGLIRMVPFPIRDQFRIQATKPRVLEFIPPDFNARFQWDPRLLTDLNPDFVTYSDFESLDLDRLSALQKSGIAFPLEIQVDISRYQTFQADLTKNYKLIATYGYHSLAVEDMRYAMTTVYLWKRTLAPSKPQ